jgi:hypothetical protein
MGPPLRRGRCRYFCVGATFVASQFQHGDIRRCHGVQVTMGSVHPCHQQGRSETERRKVRSKSKSKSKSKLLYDWRFTANQFVLASSPLRPTTRFFFRLNSCGNSPSLTRRWVCLSQICLVFRQVYISHIKHVIEHFFLLHYTQVLCQYRLYRADHAYLTYLML